MDFAANFTAIDFETASRRQDSACQLAAVVVRDGKIVDQSMWMIRPRPFSFSPSNIRIHGITPAQVEREAEFGDLWEDIANTFDGDCLVAHNASFDIGVLIGCLRTHRKNIPELHFTCTRAIARRTWPHRKGFGLKPLSEWLGIRFRHHDALEDSIACAKVLLAAGIDQEADSLEDLEKRLKLSRGAAGDWGYRGPASVRARRTSSSGGGQPKRSATNHSYHQSLPPASAKKLDVASLDLQRLMVRAEFIRPLQGKRIVFVGKLQQLDHSQAKALATRLGGTCEDTLTEQTDFLVVGKYSSKVTTAGSGDEPQCRSDPGIPERTAREMQSNGKPIEIFDEAGFLSLIVVPRPQ